MRDALLQDFSMLDDIEIITTYDARLSAPAQSQQAVSINKESNPMKVWQDILQNCDAVLIVAPETDNILAELTQMTMASKARNLGCNHDAVAIASSKYATFHAFKNANILTIPTFTASELLATHFETDESMNNGYVVKPNNGAGCEDTFYFQNSLALQEWLDLNPDKQTHFIIQPYQKGTPASISILCKNGEAWVLSCNLQKIVIKPTEFNQALIQYQGSVVNGLSAYHAAFVVLANGIAKALPGLNGYVGIDVIIDVTHNAEAIYVVEINPRITTSYIGLHESLNCNPAALLLDLMDNPAFKLPENLTSKTVEISFDE